MDTDTPTPVKRRARPAGSKPKHIILCCDGTSNEPMPARADAGATNVVHMFRCLRKTEEQIVFYDPGVGTAGILDLWRRRSDRVRALAAQATGYGLDTHVVSGYRFICENYRPGDRISLFGFSRGAYTARVIAGLIHQIGVLRAEQANLADFALKAYKESSDQDDLSIGWRFSRATATRRATIHFLGLWDTVGSMIAPLKDRIGFGLTYLPYTRSNPSVARVRHAMAIDERRRMFRIDHWKPVPFVPNRFVKDVTEPQDVLEVWFAGAHGDIGGGHAELESGLSKVSLLWMAGEAHDAKILIDKVMLERVTNEQKRKDGSLLYCGADSMGQIHAQPTGLWWVFEYLPKKEKYLKWRQRRTWFKRYLPAGEPRLIAERASIHETVAARMAAKYAPENLGASASLYNVVTTRKIDANKEEPLVPAP